MVPFRYFWLGFKWMNQKHVAFGLGISFFTISKLSPFFFKSYFLQNLDINCVLIFYNLYRHLRGYKGVDEIPNISFQKCRGLIPTNH